MKQASEAPGSIITQASAWDFSDPVVFLAVFTVFFAAGFIAWLYRWVRKNMDEDANKSD
ncbi:MAG: hypothetical protein RQ867_05580 [Mariprofundaceae bacterium]|nr:hypothetical protein [Mariprofundaceae bacterium]